MDTVNSTVNGGDKFDEIITILKDIQENERKEMVYAKKQSRFAMIISIVCLVLVVCVSLATFSLIPKVNNLVSQANLIVAQANSMMGDANAVIKNLDVVTSDLAKVDMDKLFGNVDELVIQSQDSIKNAMDKIDAIDFEGLNKAIDDLRSVVEPLAKLFRR